jgi:hypothetical protein
MRGESDRECRARGGKTGMKHDMVQFNAPASKAKKSFYSDAPVTAEPDDALTRGKGPLFRRHGGHIPESFKEHEFNKGEHAEKMKREKRAMGGPTGAGSKPSMGRAGRKTGGGVGSDLKPLTHADSPKKPPGRKYMDEDDRVP